MGLKHKDAQDAAWKLGDRFNEEFVREETYPFGVGQDEKCGIERPELSDEAFTISVMTENPLPEDKIREIKAAAEEIVGRKLADKRDIEFRSIGKPELH